MQAGRDYDGTFLPGPEAAKNGAKGGTAKTEATKRRGFGSNPELARQLALKTWEKRRAAREHARGLQTTVRGHETRPEAHSPDAHQEQTSGDQTSN